VPGEAPNDVGRVTIALTVIAGLAAMSTANFVPAASFGVLLAAMLLFVVLVRSPNGTLRS
jgi:uncharacterized membrane protein